jgi:hypothetical protein
MPRAFCMVVMSHHASKIDRAEVPDEVFFREQSRILKNVEGIWLFFPVKILDRFLHCINTLVKETKLKHLWMQIKVIT